jgi:hypothetical protein
MEAPNHNIEFLVKIEAQMAQPSSQSLIPSSFTYGKQIGAYQGFPIFDLLTDNHGVVREFKGVVSEACKPAPGAIIARPGLLYEPVLEGASV